MGDIALERKRLKWRTALLIVGALVLDAAVVLLIRMDAQKAAHSRETLSWPSTLGVVLSSAFVPGAGATRNRRECRADIAYRYEVGSRSLVSHQFSHGAFSCAELEQRASAYHVGREVRVFYDPHDPADAVLEPKERGLHWLLDIFFAVSVGALSLAAIASALNEGWIPWRRVSRQLERHESRKRARKRRAKR